MSKNIVKRGPTFDLVQRIEDLERTVEQLKANQAPSLLATSGLITVDQTAGRILFNDGTNNYIVIGTF